MDESTRATARSTGGIRNVLLPAAAVVLAAVASLLFAGGAGAAVDVPGLVEAEEYVDFVDTDAGNSGSATAFTDDVDVWNTVGEPGFTVGRIRPGESTTYDVTVTESTRYDIAIRAASGAAGGTVTIKIDGFTVGRPTPLGSTGGWWNWETTSIGEANLTVGRHVVEVSWGAGQSNFDRLEITRVDGGPPATPTATATPTTPPSPTVIDVPGPVEAEQYAGFSDTDAGNAGSATSFTDDVDVWNTVGEPGFTVGRIRSGEFTEYAINVMASGRYQLALRTASGAPAGGTATLKIDGFTVGRATQLEATGGWWSWETTVIGEANLTMGRHTLRVDWGAGQSNFDRIDVVRLDAPATPTPVPTQTPTPNAPGVLLDADFAADAQGFAYRDDVFGTSAAAYASGAYLPTGGFTNGGLQVTLGGINDSDIFGMSGAFERQFTMPAAGNVEVELRYRLTESGAYEQTEFTQALVSVDGQRLGPDFGEFVAQIQGNGNDGSARSTNWQSVTLTAENLNAGAHTIAIGGFNSAKTLADEVATIEIDDVQVRTIGAIASPDAAAVVASVNLAEYRAAVTQMASYGDRTQGSQSYANADRWLAAELAGLGYTVERAQYTYQGQPRDQIYVTKVGSKFPDRTHLVSAHYDGRGGGGAADDDASGSALILLLARALAEPGVETDVSVRMVFWNNEETGLQGSGAYAQQRRSAQGFPMGGEYPEPTWLSIIQHDMILFDHGVPAGPTQIAGADIDVEYQASAATAGPSQTLARFLDGASDRHGTAYPAQVGPNMRATDSVSFQNIIPSVSVRENRRDEFNNNANPHWHQATDVVSTYSDLDFRLGFDAVQMTIGAVAELANAQVN